MEDSLYSNSSDNNCSSSGTPLTTELEPEDIAAVVIITIVVLLGVPANVAVIVKLGRHLQGSSMSQRLFFNLALSDLLCLLCLPVGMVVFLIGHDTISYEACQLLFYVFCFCITCDINILVLISIQRYFQVLHPKKWDTVKRTWQRVLLLSVWILGALTALPVVFLLDGKKDGCPCKDHWIVPGLEVAYISYIVLSYLILLFFYVLLVRGVRRTQMPNRKQPRVTKLFIRIIAVFLVVGFLPLIFRVLHVVAHLFLKEIRGEIKKCMFVEFLFFFNHCLNPFLYFFASPHGRTGNNNKASFFMPLNDA